MSAWRDLIKPWHDTSVDYCDVCGNLLIRRYWEFADGDRVLRACRETDEQLWARLVRFRSGYPPASTGPAVGVAPGGNPPSGVTGG